MSLLKDLKSILKINQGIHISTGKFKPGDFPEFEEDAINLYSETVKNQNIVLKHPQQICSIVRSTLEDCTIELSNPAMGLVISNSYFKRCIIIAKKIQNSYQYFCDVFENCIFDGKFQGCEFGCRIQFEKKDLRGYIKDCDFSKAYLDFCLFHDTSIETLKLPPWPHVAVLNPHKNAKEIGKISNLQAFQQMGNFFKITDPGNTIVTIYVSGKGHFFKDYKNQLDFKAIEEIIRSRPDIFYIAESGKIKIESARHP